MRGRGDGRPWRRVLPLLAAVGALAACDSQPPATETPAGGASTNTAALPDTGRIFERSVVFVGTGSDSVFVVPWLWTVRTGGAEVERRARGWLLRGSVWDAFFDESWTTPPFRAPWRPVPYGPLRLMVGPGGALQQISHISTGRSLDVTLESSLAEWTGRRGETFRFLEGGLVLAERRVPGVVLDLNRTRMSSEGAGGDWMVLASGDSVMAVIHTPLRANNLGRGAWRGWARVDFRDLPLGQVTVEWAAVRAFDRARRDVPVGWTLRSPDEAFGGALEARSSQLVAEEGEGPLLPVDGLFEVAGTLTLEGIEYPVHGILRHTQGI